MVFILIQMVVHIEENGHLASNMVKEYLLLLKDQRKKAFGMRVKELNGLTKIEKNIF
jgi:hypothetical protein